MEPQSAVKLTEQDRQALLALARSAVEAVSRRNPLPAVDVSAMSTPLAAPGACFVTLTRHESGDLRGCTGVLVARGPLAEEVARTAAQTALHDPRFPPVRFDEVPDLDIEISVLTPPHPLEFTSPADIPRLLRPHIDGVTLTLGRRRATFLPQVWDKVPDPVEFLNRLCLKMGVPAGSWQSPDIGVEIYQVVEFSDHERRG